MPLSLLRRSLSHHHHHQYYLISFPLFLHRSMATTTTTATESVGPSNTRVGWIGTGVMGRSMCSHLIKAGYTLTIFNRTLSKAQPLVDMGANLADSPLSVASASDVVFSIVGFPSDVRHVLLDSTTGALQGLRPGGVLIDMTTSDPSLAAEISAAASAKNCHSIDAPVSGGDRGAKNGTLAIFAGGDKAVIDRLNPIFALMGKVNYMGMALPGLALAQQLYLSLKAHGEGNLGTQALILALERLNNISLQ
eukprot:XP_015571659.1 probable 3-hydroxyisobutyrate dehydrogenase-like 1, mitochondrial [Ricinus communis]